MPDKSLRSRIARIKPAQLIAVSFLLVITIGTVFLMLPVSAAAASPVAFLDALFTATSATCVTGLVVRVTAEGFSLFGQYVILALIQIGGLGLTTIVALVLILSTHHLMYREKIIIGEAVNLDARLAVRTFVKFIVAYVFVVELCGVILLSLRFVPEFGWGQGLNHALFTAVSAFCNAGFDNIGSNSLVSFQGDLLVNMVVSALIIAGGLGFFVWYNIYQHLFKKAHGKREKIAYHTHIVLKVTTALLAASTLIILIAEYNNPATIGNLSFGDKLMASFFQSVTLRTAGFYTFDISAASSFTKLIMCVLMFIGGSPGGTAGGIKTTTVFIVIITLINEIKDIPEAVYRFHSISRATFRKAFAVLILSGSVALGAILLLSLTEKTDLLNIVFETFSALGTVGLSLNYTSFLTSIGKFVIIILMFIGRVGPITIALVLRARGQSKRKSDSIHYPEGRILIG